MKKDVQRTYPVAIAKLANRYSYSCILFSITHRHNEMTCGVEKCFQSNSGSSEKAAEKNYGKEKKLQHPYKDHSVASESILI